MKLHLGSGYKRFPDFLNVDFDPATNPDYVVDLGKDAWPFEDNSVTEVKAHHVLEHLGDPDYFHFLKELYRVCANGALVDVRVPDARHSNFLNDPDHRRAITVEGLRLFSKKWNRICIENDDGSSKHGLTYNVDFELVDFKLTFDEYFSHLLQDVDEEKEKYIQHLIRTCNNVIVEIDILLSVVKD
jgi:hypothetical protein